MADVNDETAVIKRKSGTNNVVVVSTGSVSLNANQNFKTYKFRWFILGTICIMHVSHAINGFCFTTIADKTGEFYDVDYIQVNLLSTISMIVVLPAGFVSLIVIDNFGIRISLIISGWLNFIGALISFISSIEDFNNHKYSVLMIGRVICSISGPFSFLVTTKFANSWFTSDQRALANTISLVSGTFGFLVGSFMSPLIVNSDTDYIHQMPILNSINAGISFIPALLATFITRSSPPSPPHAQDNSENIDEKKKSLTAKIFVYFQHVGHLLKSLHFWLLLVSFTIAFSIFNAIAILLQQLLCVRGYTDTEIGIFSATMILSGIIGSILAGYIADKTKRLEEIAKICFLVSCLANIFFAIFQTYNNDDGLIRNLMILGFCLIGAFGFPLLPISMEISIECVKNIPEATATGFLFIGGQILCIICVILYPIVSSHVEETSFIYMNIQTCINSNSTFSSVLDVVDYNFTIFTQTCIYSIVSIVFILFFKCPYFRLRAEHS